VIHYNKKQVKKDGGYFFVKAPLLLTKALLPMMKEQNFGSIINIGSEVIQLGNANFSNYVTAKSAMLGMTRSWASELGQYGITVNLLNPGFIPVERHAGTNQSAFEHYMENVPLGRMGTPTDISDVVEFLASNSSGFITGQSINVNGGKTFGI
jgi:3-oxoacyl-[acyl-carrier protein] reductase